MLLIDYMEEHLKIFRSVLRERIKEFFSNCSTNSLARNHKPQLIRKSVHTQGEISEHSTVV